MAEYFTIGVEQEFNEGPGADLSAGALESLSAMNLMVQEQETLLNRAREVSGKEYLVYKVTPYAHVFADDVTRENALEGDTIALQWLDEADHVADADTVDNFDAKKF